MKAARWCTLAQYFESCKTLSGLTLQDFFLTITVGSLPPRLSKPVYLDLVILTQEQEEPNGQGKRYIVSRV